MKFCDSKVFNLFICFFLTSITTIFSQQNVSISDVNSTPDASSVLDISSTTKGLLIPRIALTATNAASPITLPATSMLVYNTATAGLSPNNVIPGYYYNAGTPAAPNWLRVNAGSSTGTEWKLLGNAGTTAGTNFLGTTDAVDLVFSTNNIEKMRILSGGNVGIGTSTPAYRLDLANGTFGFGSSNVRTESRDDAGLQGNAGAQSGFFETASPTNYPAGASSWWHLIDVRHSNNTNNFALQIAGSFFDQNLYFRKTNNSATTPWSQILTTSSNLAWLTTGNAGTVASTNFIGTTDAIDFVVRTTNAERMRVLSGGNIGIGTSTPATLFQVAGAHTTTQMRLTLPAAANGAGTGESSLHFWVSEPCVTWEAAGLGVNVNNAYLGGIGCAGGVPMPRITNGLGQAFIRFETNGGHMRFYTVDNATAIAGIGTRERMSILSNGNVGVATAAPVYKFQTDGDIYANGGWFRVSGNQGLYFESWGGGWHMQDATWIRAYNTKPILATGGLAGYGNTPFGTVFGGSPRIYANYDNVAGGGIAISDDGSLYDYNDGWITFRGSNGLFTMTNSTTFAGLYDMGTATASSATYDKNLGTNYANFGTVGSSTYYWYRMYAGGFVNSSSRDNKRNILRIDSSVNDFIMKDLENLKPSLYKYNEETDELVEGKETKYRPNYHLGLITDEAPDYLQDETFKGIDIYAASTMALLAAKNNYAEIKTIKSSLGFTSENITLQDFGSILMESKEVFVPFSDEFKEKLNGTIPVITISTSTEDANIIVIDKSAIGFKLKITGTVNNASVDYIVMAKIKVQKPIEEIPSEVINQLKVPTAEKVKIENYIEKRNSQYPSSENYNDSKFKEEAIKVQNERKSIVDNTNSNFSHPTSNPNLTEPFQKTDSQNDINETKPLKEQKSKKLKN